MTSKLQYLIFDIESVADADLVSRAHFHGKVSPEEAIAKYREELLAKSGSDFVPYTFQVPISLAILRVCEDLTFFEGDEKDALSVLVGKPHNIAKQFWGGCLDKYPGTTLVTFNGRGFDIPMLELAAFRYGIEIPKWFGADNKSDPRYRYNTNRHLDLYDKLTNFGATRFSGGLNLAATVLGKPGKMDVAGGMVQELYNTGQIDRIHDYCRCDVLDTYFVFLRVMLMSGKLNLDSEQALVARAKKWLEQKRDEAACDPNPVKAYDLYLNGWGDWPNPWIVA
ncbi:MAG: 3'-5' exonuclease [Thermoguttaceae bacterium]